MAHASDFIDKRGLCKYLGIPLTGRNPRRKYYQYIIDQVKANLKAWKVDYLFFTGRITLAKFVIAAIPTYFMMTSTLPKASLKEIQKAQMAFIWGDSEACNKSHIVCWDNITSPKCI